MKRAGHCDCGAPWAHAGAPGCTPTRCEGRAARDAGNDPRGPWMLTAGGRKFYPLDPRADEVHLDDVAHALANYCRFGGHVREFHSVAQHSLEVSHIVRALGGDEQLQLVGLLHDATEAYVGDVIRPLKRALREYGPIEARVWAAIAKRFGMPLDIGPMVKSADNIALAIERRDLMRHDGSPWDIDAGPELTRLVDLRIVPMLPREAKAAFLRRAWDLMPHERPATKERP